MHEVRRRCNFRKRSVEIEKQRICPEIDRAGREPADIWWIISLRG
jgi:hypothetical protein